MQVSIISGLLRKILMLSLLALSLMAIMPVIHAQEIITVGTGGVKGVYYPLGGAICSALRRKDITCAAEATMGSIYNLNALRGGELDMGIVQSDVQYNAYHGLAEFQNLGPFQDLRAVFSAHIEPFTVVVRRGANIRSLDDLKGKRVNIGNPGSGQRSTMERLMAAKGWTLNDFALASELESGEQARALCDNKVDAIAFTVGHPNASIEEATSRCDSTLIAVTGPEVDRLVAEHPYYVKATIAGGLYRGNPQEVQTFAVKATVVATTRTSEEIVYQTVKSLFDHFSAFRRVHPGFIHLTKEAMVLEGNSAPLHGGAERYFREAGLLGEDETASR